jgi:hypothetical protein
MFPFIQAARIGVKVDCQPFKLHELLSAQTPAIKAHLVDTLQTVADEFLDPVAIRGHGLEF